MDILWLALSLFIGIMIGFFAGVKFVFHDPQMIAEFVKKHGR